MHLTLKKVLLIIVVALMPLVALAETQLTTPIELTSQGRDRGSYDIALEQLDEAMKRRVKVPDYEDMVDLFAQYRDHISPEEMGGTIYDIYSRVGPKPSKKYYAQRKI